MKVRPACRPFLVLAFSAASLTGGIARAATTRVQNQFLSGEFIASPASGTANLSAILAARELQAGPRRSETPDLYGRRAQAIAVALGLTGPEAVKAGEFYRTRAWARAINNSSGSLLRTGPGSSRAALEASSRRARAAMHDPGWASAVAPRTLLSAGTPVPARASWPEIKTTPLMLAPTPRKRTVVPAPAPPASTESLLSRLSSGFHLPEFLGLGREKRIRTLNGWSADYNRSASAITEKNTGDSASGWFRRQRLSAQGAFYAMGALVNDPSAMKQASNAAGESIVRGMFPDKLYEAGHPGTWKTAIIHQLGEAVPMKWRLMFSVGSIGVKQGADDAAVAVRAVKNYGVHGSFWNAADATMSIGALGLDLAAVTPAGAARFGILKAAGVPRTFLKTSGIRRELAATLEANYQRAAELHRSFRAKKIAGAPAAELAAIREESWNLYHQNAALQTEIPALRDYFATAKAGEPASLEVMQVVAANMGTELETVSGVRLAGYTALPRDMRAGGVKPNAGKALDDGTMTGSAAHLLRDGSAHMVSVADRLTGGLVLLMTGYADAHRATKTMSGLMYEFEGVKNAARVPLPREVFSDALTQGELMVPEVPMKNIKRVRSWRAEINPANPSQLIFRYSEPLVAVEGLNPDALVATLKDMPHSHSMRVEIPADTAPFINR